VVTGHKGFIMTKGAHILSLKMHSMGRKEKFEVLNYKCFDLILANNSAKLEWK